MIFSLLTTLVIEETVVFLFGKYRKKPLESLVISSLIINFLTQFLLWIVLTLFNHDYMKVLILSELGICLVEGVFLFLVRSNQLRLIEAAALSIIMNAASFGIGLILPF